MTVKHSYKTVARDGLRSRYYNIYYRHACLMIPSNKWSCLSVRVCSMFNRAHVICVFVLLPLRLARWCAAGWSATATTPMPTCSAARSATLDWAASACTRMACSPTAAGTRGWRTASSASAWWVGTDVYTNNENLDCRHLDNAFIWSQLWWE